MKKITSSLGAIALATLLTCSTALAQAANGDQNTTTTPKAQAEAGKGQPASNPQGTNAQKPSQTQTAKDEQARRDTGTAQATTRDITRGTGNSNPGRVSETQPKGMSDKWAQGKDTATPTRDGASAPNSNPGRMPVARDTNSSLLKNTASSTRTPSDNVARSSDKTTAPNPSRPVQGTVSTSPNSP